MASKPKPRNIFRPLVIIFLVLSLGIGIVGYLHYKYQVAEIKKDKQNDLAGILKLKTEQIVNWRRERLADAQVIFGDQFLARRIKDYFTGKPKPELNEEILNRLAGLMIYQYRKIILIGGRGEVGLSFPQLSRACDSYTLELVSQVMKSKEIIFSDFYQDDVSQEICLSLLIPILAPPDKSLVGIILIKIDPRQFLFPLLQTWPTPSKTGETLLLRREGEEAVFLNELRHRQGSALTLRLPLVAPNLCVTMVARGVTGVFEGKDYRGHNVLAAGNPVPDSPWYLLAKVDHREIFLPLSDHIRQTGLLLLTLVASCGLGMAYIWRNHQAAFYRQQFETERDKAILAHRYASLIKYANDIIVLADQDLRLLEVNDRAVASYGYEKDELLRLSLWDLHPAEARPLLEEKLQQVTPAAGLLFETGQLRRDGTTFPVEFSLNRQEIDGQPVYQGIIREVTERKEAEAALRRSQANLAAAQRIAHLGSWEWNILTGSIMWSEEMYHIYGLPLRSPPSSYLEYLSFLHPEDRQMVVDKVNDALRGEAPYRLDFRIVKPDGAVRILHNEGEVTFAPSGQPASFIGIAQDVTELKQTEQALRESENSLRSLTQQLLTAQETERHRISVLLHDDLGQALMVFNFQLRTLKDKLRQEGSPLSHDCEEMLQYLHGLLNKVRQLSRNLNPPGLPTELGFQAAVKYLLEEFGKYYGIGKTSLVADDVEPLFSKKSLALIYRVLQEALTNIGRHAEASEVAINIKRSGDQVSFTVRDNGRGFDQEQVLSEKPIPAGLGLPSMQERVKMLGGSFDVRSNKGSGTTIAFTLPLQVS